jgi:hypothetical protein
MRNSLACTPPAFRRRFRWARAGGPAPGTFTAGCVAYQASPLTQSHSEHAGRGFSRQRDIGEILISEGWWLSFSRHLPSNSLRHKLTKNALWTLKDLFASQGMTLDERGTVDTATVHKRHIC